MIVMNPEARRKADKELNRRDRIFQEGEDMDEYLDDYEDEEAEIRRRREYY